MLHVGGRILVWEPEFALKFTCCMFAFQMSEECYTLYSTDVCDRVNVMFADFKMLYHFRCLPFSGEIRQ